ncbi:hypothetical protein C1H46_001298 [Malus baccata]|uniref:Protein kinase domain-containing protein n=1 Tax=Malus baccata TaxID=106549 RepID=A0A540NQA3_MALBA|nr:hypothetical protein C1H46_001298 [Malus baccata]
MGWMMIPCSGNSNCKAKTKKKRKNKIELQDKPLDQIKPTSGFSKTSSILSVKEDPKDGGSDHIEAQTFVFRELAAATRNFRAECLLGEGGFGRVFKGRLERTNQVVAIKQLDHVLPGKRRLDWNTRMKIAAGAAKGLKYLHDKASPPVIHRNLKCSNILLGEGYHPKLSGFGLAKLGSVGDNTHVSTRVMGTYGYCAPEYAMTGQLTLKSDIYSFGVVLLEIITGWTAIDNTRGAGEQILVEWARTLFKDRRKLSQMADPTLQGQYPKRGLYQALAVAGMCVQEQPNMRPVIADVVTALTYLASQKYDH